MIPVWAQALRGHDRSITGWTRRLNLCPYFERTPVGTRMRDVFEFAATWGVVGRLAERLVLTNYLRRFLVTRALALKRVAESGEGSRFCGPGDRDDGGGQNAGDG